MSENFDPYFEWFDIAIEERPINYYRLLDLNRFESKPEVISAALENQINKVTEFLDGEHHAEAQRILEEIRIAGKVLLDEEAKLKYDIGLDPKRAPKPKPVLDPNARLQPKPKPEPEPEPEEEPESEPESAPSLKEEEKPEIKSESEPEPAPAPKEEEKPEKKDAPKPPLPSLTKRPPQPKPPILTKLPPGAKDPAAHNNPKTSVTPPPAPVQPPTPPRVILKPVPVAVPASTAAESALQENLGFIKEELDTKPEFDFDAIIAQKNRTIFILGLACGFLLVMVSVLAIALVSQTGQKPTPIAQAVSEQEADEEEAEAEEEISEEDSIEKEDDSPINNTNPRESIPTQTPQANPPLPQPQVFEEAEDEAQLFPEELEFEEKNTIGFQPDQKENPDLNRNNPPQSPFEKSPWQAGTQRVLNIDGVEYSFRWCPAGQFYASAPSRHVAITKGFWILETEVTQAMWQSVMGYNPSTYQQGATINGLHIETKTNDYPVETVSWKECSDFCERLAQKTHLNIQLPTEAQWELAYQSGFNNLVEYKMEDEQNYSAQSNNSPVQCRSSQPNTGGIYDMNGNVAEWCADWYSRNIEKGDIQDPEGPDIGAKRLYHGNILGSRLGDFPDSKSPMIGFRFIIASKNLPEVSIQNDIASNSVEKKPKTKTAIQNTPVSKQAGALRTIELDGIKYRFRWCPPGEFMMGDFERKDDLNNVDIPHRVVLTHGFWILETEVTQEMWTSIMGQNLCAFRPEGREAGAVPNMDTSLFPVDSVSWDMCQEFCQKLSQKIGVTAKLPTEAQWEYACRAGTTTPYYTGTELTQEQGNFKDFNTINPLDRTTTCRSYPPNAWGIYDMHGNVEEWCEDWYKQGYYHISPLEDPQGPDAGREKVVRGGSWYHGSSMCKSATRSKWPASTPWYFGGFRFILVDDSQADVVQQAEKDAPEEVTEKSVLVTTPKKPDTKVKSTPEKNVPEMKINPKLKKKKNKTGEQAIQQIDGIEYRFRWCPPGTFMMGEGINGQLQVGPNTFSSRPPLNDLHPITLSKGFWILETEVTQEMWLKIMGKNPSSFSPTGREAKKVRGQNTTLFPVESVSWEDCQQFCAILSQKTGLNVKLPTEAQWEYACRAGTRTPYNTGMNLTVQLANVADSNVVAPIERPVPCGSYPPNAWGIHDMHGNIAEWCQDHYLQGYYKISPKVDPPGPENGEGHIYRGGSWNTNFHFCTSGNRGYILPNSVSQYKNTIGFRFVIIQD